ncbi:HYR domain-containing protein [Pontibacter sp. CAU 1760]
MVSVNNSYCNSAPVAIAKSITISADDNCAGNATAGDFNDGSTDEDGDELDFSVVPVGPYPLGETTVTLTVTDSKGASNSTNATVTVVDASAPVLSAAPTNITVYTGTDASGCTATATWAALTATDNCGTVTVDSNYEPGATFPVGTTTVTYTATDDAGNEAEQRSFTVTVIDNTPPTISAPAAISQHTDPGSCGATISDLGSATYGDNCAGATVENDAPAVFPIGTTTVTWTVTDAAGYTATATQQVTVTDNEFPELSLPDDIVVSNQAGSCGAIVTYLPTATDNCAGVTVETDIPSGATFAVGTTTVNVTATDAAGNVSAGSFTVTVNNDAPVLSNILPTDAAPMQINSAMSFTASCTDNNLQSASWNWGDGSNSVGTINGTGLSGSHTYSATGVYTVGLTVTDACGSTATTNFQYTVVYDPEGGFVTGGGWIDSPAGAYRSDASKAGKANFGFVSKYKKGATVPTGDTNFEFKAADLHFKSSSYEWLVISGATARYKGEGTINGFGNYGFILAATDGQVNGGGNVDKFRIRIWDKNNNDAVVYDNNLGDDADDALAETIIGGGSIVVHSPMKGSASNKLAAASSTALSGTSFYSYPTAFAEKTTIAFRLKQEEPFMLEVYDMKGALVRKLASGTAEAEKLYEFELRGNGMPQGVYLVRLSTALQVRSLKAVLKR